MKMKVALVVLFLLLGVGLQSPAALTINTLGSSMGNEIFIQSDDKDGNGLIDVLFVGAEFDIQEKVNLDIYVNFYENGTFSQIYDEYRYIFIDQMGLQNISIDIQGLNLYDLNFTGNIEIEVETQINTEDGSSAWFTSDRIEYHLDYLNFEQPPVVLNSYNIFFEDIYDYGIMNTGTDGLFDVIILELNFSIDILGYLNIWGNVWSTTWYNDNYYDDHAYNHDNQIVTRGNYILELTFSPGDLFNMSDAVDLRFDISYELYNYDTNGNWIEQYYAYDEFDTTVNGTDFAPPVFTILETPSFSFVDTDSSGLYDQIDVTFNILIYIDVRINMWLDIYYFDPIEGNKYIANTNADFDVIAGTSSLTISFDSVFLGQYDFTDSLFISYSGEYHYYNDQIDTWFHDDRIPFDVDTTQFDIPPVFIDYDSVIIEGRNNPVSLDEVAFDYLYMSVVIVVNEGAWLDIWMDLNLANDYWFYDYIYDQYETGNHTLEFIIDGANLYDTHIAGDSWLNVGGYTNSDKFDYNLGGRGISYYFDSNDFKSDGKYEVPGDDGISDEPFDPENTTTTTDDGTNDATNSKDSESAGPTLDLPLPAPSVYLSIFGFAAIVIIRKKRY